MSVHMGVVQANNYIFAWTTPTDIVYIHAMVYTGMGANFHGGVHFPNEELNWP